MHLPLEYGDICKILPHRYPFLLVDRVTELVPEKHIVAIKNVTANEPYFMGHFPGMPIMPGVLQIEALAQAMGILAFHSGHFDPEKQVAFLAGINDVRFRKPVVPGDQLMLRAELVAMKGHIFKAKGTAEVSGIKVSEATIIVAVQNRS